MRSMLSNPRRPPRLIRNVFGDPAGSTAVIIALALSAIVGFAGLGTETASWYLTKRSMQGAADTAAATAAAELAASSLATIDQMRSAARSVSSRYGFVNGTASTTITVDHPPASGTYSACPSGSGFAGTDCYVEVVISQPQTALLSAVFLSSGPTITARAVALANTGATDPGCVISLSTQTGVDINVSGNAAMNFSGCALYDNASGSNALSVSGNGASITALAAYVVGGVTGGSQVHTTDGIFTGVNPVADPYASVPTPSYTSGHCDQGDFNGNGHPYHLNANQSVTLPPASFSGSVYVFCDGIDMQSNSTTLILRPGFVYVVDQGQVKISGNSTITQCGTTYLGPPVGPIYAPCTVGPVTQSGGITFFLTNHTGGNPATISVPSGATVNLTAPNSGSTAGIAFFQDRVACSSTCTSTLAGAANFNVTGALYFPKNDVSYTGGSSAGSQCTQLIANTITLSGGSTFNSTCTSAGTKTISYTNGTLVL
jgi:Flp pilus assembly protein TadG